MPGLLSNLIRRLTYVAPSFSTHNSFAKANRRLRESVLPSRFVSIGETQRGLHPDSPS